MEAEHIEIRVATVARQLPVFHVIYLAMGREVLLPDNKGRTYWHLTEADHVQKVARWWAGWLGPRKHGPQPVLLPIYKEGERVTS